LTQDQWKEDMNLGSNPPDRQRVKVTDANSRSLIEIVSSNYYIKRLGSKVAQEPITEMVTFLCDIYFSL